MGEARKRRGRDVWEDWTAGGYKKDSDSSEHEEEQS